jgi:hypothetical protein
MSKSGAARRLSTFRLSPHIIEAITKILPMK